MATIRSRPESPPRTIDKFLGLNEDTSGDTELKLGESPAMINFRITENFKLRKREGYREVLGFGDGKINGMHTYKNHVFIAHGTRIYKFELEELE